MTRLLLDTHALVWWWLADSRLSDAASDAINDRSRDIFVSAVTAFEIANKVRLGKLPTMSELVATYDLALAQDGFGSLPLDGRHAHHAGLLAGEHRDPFDRMIAAQALFEDMIVVTRDPQIAGFGCKVLW